MMLVRTHLLVFLLVIILRLVVSGRLSPATPSPVSDANNRGMRFQLYHRHGPELLGSTIAPEDRPEHFQELAQIDHTRKKTISAKIHAVRRKATEKKKKYTPPPPSNETSYMRAPITSGADFNKGLYYTKLRLGTPPQEFSFIVDSGSDLTWVNCRYRCQHCPLLGKCLTQKRVFTAGKSSSFNMTLCSSDMCPYLPSAIEDCRTKDSPCLYNYTYMKGVAAAGFYANESATVTMSDGEDLEIKDLVIGCTTSDKSLGTFAPFDGLMALSFHPISFLGLAMSNFGFRIFYCLVDHLSSKNHSNHIFIGHVPKAPTKLSYTELNFIEAYHAIKVEGVSVDGRLLPVPPMVWREKDKGGVILDTGTSLMHFVQPSYEVVFPAIEEPLKKAFGQYESHEAFKYCFRWDAKKGDEREVEEKAPKLVFHMKGGAVFQPHVKSYILEAGKDVRCLGIVSTEWPGVSIIGNIFQQNFFWEIDVENNRLGFAPSKCDH